MQDRRCRQSGVGFCPQTVEEVFSIHQSEERRVKQGHPQKVGFRHSRNSLKHIAEKGSDVIVKIIECACFLVKKIDIVIIKCIVCVRVVNV